MKISHFAIGAALLALTACSGGETSNTTAPVLDGDATAFAGQGGYEFFVIGDAPYGPEDEQMLAEAVPLIKSEGTPFVIHLGDYKGGRAECTSEHDEAFQALVADLAPIPVMYTPGDNEWTDCDRNIDPETGEYYSELGRLAEVRKALPWYDDETYAALSMARQGGQPENLSWQSGGVQFLTLHVTGTNNARHWVVGDDLDTALEAADTRDALNLEWLESGFDSAKAGGASAIVIAMHGDPALTEGKIGDAPCTEVSADDSLECDGFMPLRRRLAELAAGFDGPVLIIHGDTAPFTLNQDMAGDEAPNLWRLNAAGDSGIGRTGEPYGTRDITRVSVLPEADIPFAAEGVLTGKAAKAKD